MNFLKIAFFIILFQLLLDDQNIKELNFYTCMKVIILEEMATF